MTQYEHDGYDSIMNNQDHIIYSLQDHETHLTRKEEKVKQLVHRLEKLNEELQGISQQDAVLAELNVATNFARAFNSDLVSIQRGLYTNLKKQLDPSLIALSTKEKALVGARYLPNRRGLSIALVFSVDIYQVETNFVDGEKFIFVLLHIPLLKTELLAEIYRYLGTPIDMKNSTKHIAIQPVNSLIALNNDRKLFTTFSAKSLNRYKKLYSSFWCPDHQVQKRPSMK